MPVSPDLAANLAAATVEHYLEAERILLARIARALAADLDAPDWAERKLLQVQLLRLQLEQAIAALTGQATGTVGEAILTAYNRGGATAAADLAGMLGRSLEDLAEPISGGPAVERLILDTLQVVTATHPRILRAALDGYRQVVADATAQVLLGTTTRREAAQRALDTFAARGVTGFVDRAGRGWDLASYVEMAVRTSTGNAAVTAHTDRLQSYGQDLVLVSDSPQECKVCRPWEGKVLSLSGTTVGTISGSRGVRVAGTLAGAKSAGLFHPGCRHSVALYQPGVTRLPGRTVDPEGDAARQRLRYLERRVRAAKREQAAALDKPAAQRAAAKVAAGQAAIRDHVATSPAKRQSAREQIGRAR